MRFSDKKENDLEELLKIPIELRSNDQFKKIAEMCYSAYEVDPKNIFAMREMMTCSLHLWMSDNAIFWADKILEIDECDLFALGTKASALSDKGMHGKDKTSTQESVNIYKIILEIDENNPANTRFWISLGKPCHAWKNPEACFEASFNELEQIPEPP